MNNREEENFVRDCLNLPFIPLFRMPQLRESGVAQVSPLEKPLQPKRTRQNFGGKRTMAKWNNGDLEELIGTLANGYSMGEVCEVYSILRTSLKDHYNGRIKCRKMGLQSIFTK